MFWDLVVFFVVPNQQVISLIVNNQIVAVTIYKCGSKTFLILNYNAYPIFTFINDSIIIFGV